MPEALPVEVAEVRADICGRCEQPCARQKDGVFHADPCSACPRVWPARWGQHGCGSLAAAPPRGLGDLVASVAQPIAKLIDGALKTNIRNCGGCQDRKAQLNKMVPKLF